MDRSAIKRRGVTEGDICEAARNSGVAELDAIREAVLEEAMEELEFAVRQLGYKVAMLGSLMDRPVAAAGNVEGEAKRFTVWKDVIGLDSEYDYDPVWAKYLELNIAPSFHSGARRSGLRLSPSRCPVCRARGRPASEPFLLSPESRTFPRTASPFLVAAGADQTVDRS